MCERPGSPRSDTFEESSSLYWITHLFNRKTEINVARISDTTLGNPLPPTDLWYRQTNALALLSNRKLTLREAVPITRALLIITGMDKIQCMMCVRQCAQALIVTEAGLNRYLPILRRLRPHPFSYSMQAYRSPAVTRTLTPRLK